MRKAVLLSSFVLEVDWMVLIAQLYYPFGLLSLSIHSRRREKYVLKCCPQMPINK